MNFNYSYNSEEFSVIDKEFSVVELICNEEIDSIINAIKNDFGCSIFSDLIKDMAIQSKNTRGQEKFKATNELKDTFRKMINCFPPDILEKHHLRINAEYATRHDDFISERYHTKKKLISLPSNDEIQKLWLTKRQERKKLQDQIIAGGSSLKRGGLNSDVVENICKKLK